MKMYITGSTVVKMWKRFHIHVHHTIQSLITSKGAQRQIFYHITVILLLYWLDKTIARSGDMYEDDSVYLSFVIKCFAITNTSVQNCVVRISSLITELKCLRKQFVKKFNMHVSSLLMSSLRAIVICQKYFRISVISSKILLFAPLLVMMRCTLCTCKCTLCMKDAMRHVYWNSQLNFANDSFNNNPKIGSWVLIQI